MTTQLTRPQMNKEYVEYYEKKRLVANNNSHQRLAKRSNEANVDTKIQR